MGGIHITSSAGGGALTLKSNVKGYDDYCNKAL
jgi:hypothetical protein